MILKVFSVYDSKAEAYLPPFFMQSEGQARRIFGDCCNDEGHQFGKHPEDYTLFEIAEFDDGSAVVTPSKTPMSFGLGLEYISESYEDASVAEGLKIVNAGGTK